MMSTTFAGLTLLSSLCGSSYYSAPVAPTGYTAGCHSACCHHGNCLYPLAYPLNPAPYFSPYQAVYHPPKVDPKTEKKDDKKSR